MTLNETVIANDDKKWHTRNVKDELGYCGVYMKDRKDITNLDLHFIAWLCRASLRNIKELENGKQVHAHWERRTDVLVSYFPYKCSHCNDTNITDSNYCPNCGALMREDEEHGI